MHTEAFIEIEDPRRVRPENLTLTNCGELIRQRKMVCASRGGKL